MTMIIVGKDCEDCGHCTAVDDSNPARIKVYCSYDDKYRWWGQCIPCDNKVKKINEQDNGGGMNA